MVARPCLLLRLLRYFCSSQSVEYMSSKTKSQDLSWLWICHDIPQNESSCFDLWSSNVIQHPKVLGVILDLAVIDEFYVFSAHKVPKIRVRSELT